MRRAETTRRGGAGVSLLLGATLAIAGVAAGARVSGAEDGDAARDARRILAAGQVLPAGLTALGLERATVMIDMSGRGTPRERRRPKIAGAFTLNGASITFQTIRGRRIPRRWRDDEDPRHELEVCFKDAAGRPFLVQLGGDEVLDPSCDPERQQVSAEGGAPGALLVAADGDSDLAVASAALEALAGLAFRSRFADEHAALIGHAELTTNAEQGIEPDCEAENTFCEEDGGLVTSSHDNRWRHILEVWSGPIRRIPGATHGATIAFRQDPRNNRITMAWHRCNHGRCYYDDTMRFQCAFWSRFDRVEHVHLDTCTTAYSPRSGADWWWPGHNSNDDTSAEYRTVRNNRHYATGWGSGWPCDDPYSHNNTSPCF